MHPLGDTWDCKGDLMQPKKTNSSSSSIVEQSLSSSEMLFGCVKLNRLYAVEKFNSSLEHLEESKLYFSQNAATWDCRHLTVFTAGHIK